MINDTTNAICGMIRDYQGVMELPDHKDRETMKSVVKDYCIGAMTAWDDSCPVVASELQKGNLSNPDFDQLVEVVWVMHDCFPKHRYMHGFYIKKLPIVRHIRYLWLSWRVRYHADMWARIGIGLGVPNKSDLDHLDKIWHGDA